MPISVSSQMSRPQLNYGPQNSRFLKSCDFSKQYHHYYRKRLEMTRPKLEARCLQEWGPDYPVSSLADLANPKSTMCVIIGTIFKKMKMQPDVIEELSKGNFDISSEHYAGHYTSQDDILTLEDDEESVQLAGKIEARSFVTGVTVALLGCPVNDGGKFLVDKICYVEPSHSSNLTSLRSSRSDNEGYLLIVSSLGFHHDMNAQSKLTSALRELINFVWSAGKFSGDKRGANVSRVLVVGNSLHVAENPLLDGESELDKVELDRLRQSRRAKPYAESIEMTKLMDDFFAQLAKTVHVDLMPGPLDPASHLMPQQPFHPCMFPKSSLFPTFNCTTNPHSAIYGSAEVLATSGQNVDVIKKFSDLSDTIEIMKCHLRWGNSAPSAPDNLFSIPFEDEDPFIIENRPDIYIAGGQKSFQSEYYELGKDGKSKTLLLSIPEFHKTFSCVLLDMKSLETQLIAFE